MKILYITNGITGSGGLERVLSVKASLLAEDFGYEVHLLGLNEINKKPFFVFSEVLKIHSIDVSGNSVQYISQYKKGIQHIVDEVMPDFISVCDDGLKGFFLPYIVHTKARWVYESHASVYLADKGKGVPLRRKLEHHIKQTLGKKFSKVILLTERNRKDWKLPHISVIPNPIPFEPSESANLKSKKVIAVGSFSFNKGYDLLLDIWKNIENDLSDWELHIYGKEVIKNLTYPAQQCGLRNIYFHEPILDIQSRYLQSSIFVLPSRSEGFGMVLIEAMNCGLPVISFNCPHGPADIISDRVDGFLIENGNIPAFVEKLEKLMNNQELREKMGAFGKIKSERYSVNIIIKQWDQLFKNLS